MDRRQFMVSAGAFSAGVAMCGGAVSASSGCAILAKMTWLNPPSVWKLAGETLTVQASPKTDFWRKTFNNIVADNAPFFHAPATGTFAFQARALGRVATQFDQAGLMVRFDAENWLKCGTELFEGRRKASVVVTREGSDWSTMPDFSETGPVWWRAVRGQSSLEIYASADGKTFTLVRSAYFPPSAGAEVGLYCCSPDGPSFETVFDQVSLS